MHHASDEHVPQQPAQDVCDLTADTNLPPELEERRREAYKKSTVTGNGVHHRAHVMSELQQDTRLKVLQQKRKDAVAADTSLT